MKINLVWLRRDLRLGDNTALNQAMTSGLPVLPVFIFDINITEELPSDDPRISFIYENLTAINTELLKSGSSIVIKKGDPLEIWKELIVSYDINAVYINKDYEPYAIQRDKEIKALLAEKNIPLMDYKDQVIFEEREIIKSDNYPYTIFTPYKKKWLQKFEDCKQLTTPPSHVNSQKLHKIISDFPSLKNLAFNTSSVKVKPYEFSKIHDYDKTRDYPSADNTSYLGPHLRFGTVSIRKVVILALHENKVFLDELIWREFFMQIIFNFPSVVSGNFKPKYDNIQWRNDENEFERWCRGETGYQIVDAGMRQLNKTGYMHNRVRMIAAGFLCKHLLIDWRWGEAYFAQKLLDYELSSNNGNWQWAAGTGCDAAPYFRVFNPDTQQKKFDKDKVYIRKWIEDINKSSYPLPLVEHNFARIRAISSYKSGIKA